MARVTVMCARAFVAALLVAHAACSEQEHPLAPYAEVFCQGVSTTLRTAADKCTTRDESGVFGDMSWDARNSSGQVLWQHLWFCVSVRRATSEERIPVLDRLLLRSARFEESEEPDTQCQNLREMTAIFDEWSTLPLAY